MKFFKDEYELIESIVDYAKEMYYKKKKVSKKEIIQMIEDLLEDAKC